MIINTRNYCIHMDNRLSVGENTRFVAIPSSILTFRGAKVYIPSESTMVDGSLVAIFRQEASMPVAFAMSRRNPSDQPNRQVGFMVALYYALADLRKTDRGEFDKVVAEIDTVIKGNKSYSRLVKYWDVKFVDAPADVADLAVQQKQKKAK